MEKRLFITGNSSGLGRGLTETYLGMGWQVYGVSRRGFGGTPPGLVDARCDLSDFEAVPRALEKLLDGVVRLDLVILNAGVLGRIADLHDTSLEEIRSVMEINVWSNKVIIDWLIDAGIAVDQMILISSGAAVNGHRGWGAYSLSKATLNMLGQLYAHEMSDTHITSLAPGLVDTAMQDYLCEEVDAARFDSIQRLRSARNTPAMPKPDAAGRLIADIVPRLKDYPSGSFLDVRKLG
ncbi:MAG TPA: SDR family NAD(P)-dependent oxidoreductase [Sedimenticola sp.]|nr:SDR family NAD(P)-dependent oxidoreductase [Sedimenticola sp.]